MDRYSTLKLREHPELADKLSEWFSSKWNVPKAAYDESMDECIQNKKTVPQWYAAICSGRIVGGLGVIENDFHERKDLRPNVCAVFVEDEWRGHGIAGKLLDFACADMTDLGETVLYLVTDHNTFYERYGWEFIGTVKCDGQVDPSRMYCKKV